MKRGIVFLLAAGTTGIPCAGQQCFWTPQTGPLPSPRNELAADVVGGETVLFGGIAPEYVFLRDTWVLGPSGWSFRDVPGPPPRCGHAMAGGLLFGGYVPGGRLADTWRWDGQAWTQLNAPGPAARNRHGMAFDSGRNRVVLFGGCGDTIPRFGDTWEWDGAAWLEREPASRPSARLNLAMCYDPVRARTVLFGGHDTLFDPIGDTWEWDGSNWMRVSTTGPTPRYGARLAYDPIRARSVLTGGGDSREVNLTDTWTWDGSSWSMLAPCGPDTRFCGMAYNPARQSLVVFGGRSADSLGWSLPSSACYANCDGSTTPPVLNVADLTCFAARFAAGSSYANCDGSSLHPVLNVSDFICFMGRFAQGCS